MQWKWEMKWEMIWCLKWEWNDYDMEMFDNVCMCYENEKWNENGNGIWSDVETEWNDYEVYDNVNMCAMACTYVQWKWEM